MTKISLSVVALALCSTMAFADNSDDRKTFFVDAQMIDHSNDEDFDIGGQFTFKRETTPEFWKQLQANNQTLEVTMNYTCKTDKTEMQFGGWYQYDGKYHGVWLSSGIFEGKGGSASVTLTLTDLISAFEGVYNEQTENGKATCTELLDVNDDKSLCGQELGKYNFKNFTVFQVQTYDDAYLNSISYSYKELSAPGGKVVDYVLPIAERSKDQRYVSDWNEYDGYLNSIAINPNGQSVDITLKNNWGAIAFVDFGMSFDISRHKKIEVSYSSLDEPKAGEYVPYLKLVLVDRNGFVVEVADKERTGKLVLDLSEHRNGVKTDWETNVSVDGPENYEEIDQIAVQANVPCSFTIDEIRFVGDK